MSNHTASVAASPEPAQAARASARCRSMAASKPGPVDAQAPAAQHVLGEVEGKAVGVVKLERDPAGQGVAAAEPGGGLVEQLEAAVEGLLEARLLELERLGDQRLGTPQVGNAKPIWATRAGTSRHISGSSQPIRWAWRMARRMIRRST